MGRTTRAETARRNRYQTPVNRGAYVDGNTVRRLNEIPERRQEAGRNRRVQSQPVPQTQHQLSKQAQQNRQRALGMNWAFCSVSGCCMRSHTFLLGKLSQIQVRDHSEDE